MKFSWHSFFAFPYATLGAVFFVILCFFWLFMNLTNINEKDIQSYRSLLNLTKTDKPNSSSYKATQQHNKTNKYILFTKNEQRLQLSIDSKHSELVLENTDAGTEAVEHMSQVVCKMQEELYYQLPNGQEVSKLANGTYVARNGKSKNPLQINESELIPKQIIRCLEAENASYFYQTDHFKGDKVKIVRFVTPSHDFNISKSEWKLLMEGKANSVEFYLGKGDLDFKANDFKAIFSAKGT